MFSIYYSLLSKIEVLIYFIKSSINTGILLTMITYLSTFIVVMKLLSPIYRMILNLIWKKAKSSSTSFISTTSTTKTYPSNKHSLSILSSRKYNKMSSSMSIKIPNSSNSSTLSNSTTFVKKNIIKKSLLDSSSSKITNKIVKSKNPHYKIKLNKRKINKTLRNFKLD